MVALTHKIELDPTCKQKTYFGKGCGVARFTWNWALAKWEEEFKAGKKPNALSLKKAFNSQKSSDFPWVYEVTKYASQQPFIHLQRAFQNFFAKRAKYPKFKKKGIRDSFYIGGDQLTIQENKVKIPLLGWVRLRESLRFEGKINGATISCSAGRWFISVSVETDHHFAQCKNQARVGIDLGVKALATLSNGISYSNKTPLQKRLKQLKRLQKKLSRCQKQSENRSKIKKKLGRLHYKVACNRSDILHKLTTDLTRNYQYIVIEDLDISSMVKNRRLSRSIADCGFYEFRRQLSYKAKLRGNTIFVADKWFASSKKCSGCGQNKESLTLSERVYHCTHCDLEMDRDDNASRCLEQLIDTASSAGIDVCGQDGSVIMLKPLSQPAWLKQKLSRV